MRKEATFFETPSEFRDWLEEHHDSEEVLWVGYYKVATGKPSMRWEESVREALCFGWIDGLRKSIDDESYKIRFTPRNPNSHWSKKNIEMVEELIEEDRMQPPGLKAFEQMDKDNAKQASYERKSVELKKEYKDKIKANEKAWTFFQELAPGYTKTSVHWVMSAKQENTRQRRLKILIESCEEGKKIPPRR
jgi:uncharacterized protein YdeI (YjbR/CyaY-like superfamily)